MEKPRILSGDELVLRGTTKIDASLPELGLKEVTPNGSWLEQKQIQSALEARKHLIEVQRIEKCGSLSHAEWREDLMKAEVSQKAGGYWQYLGHNVGKHLYLNPEEALYLMEVNCLQLKYNEVTVSLQQAYSLLLRSKISVVEYKVFASLSRLGYKVVRYEDSKLTEYEKKLNLTKNIHDSKEKGDKNEEKRVESNGSDENFSNGMEIDNNVNISNEPDADDKNEDTENKCDNENKMDTEVIENTKEKEEVGRGLGENSCFRGNNVNQTGNVSMDINEDRSFNVSEATAIETDVVKSINSKSRVTTFSESSSNYLQKLEKRKLRSINSKDIDRYFELVPDLFQKQTVTLKVPEEKHIPQNIFLNKLSYVLNIETIRSKTDDSVTTSVDSRPYSASDDVNGDHIRRVRDVYGNYPAGSNWNNPFANERFVGPFPQYRPFQFWRPTTFNFLLQRPFLPPVNYLPRFNLIPPTPPPPLIQYANNSNFNANSGNNRNMHNIRKRAYHSVKKYHFETIQRLAARLRLLVDSGNMQSRNINALQRVIHTYNLRYKTTLHFNDQFDVVSNDSIIETIELDEDEGAKKKRPRLETGENENLNNLKLLATELKKLSESKKVTSRHRRAFANVLQRFNKSYNTDLYLSDDYEILDKRYITLDSSSDSDCVIEEKPKAPKGKKLRNPFNILKRLSEKQNSSISIPSTSAESINERTKSVDETSDVEDKRYSELILETFHGNWRPHEEDFGRVEVPPKNLMHNKLFNNKKEEYLYEFIKNQPYDFENWLDVKLSFYKSIEESTKIAQSELADTENPGLNSIIGPGDCTDTSAVLKKLSIIKCCTTAEGESNLRIDFDVYHRDVQNFRKSNRPKPHFRVSCINDSTSFPSGSDIASLHAKYNDNVVILFAVVSVGSISYLQIKPSDLPVYIPSNDLT